MTEAPQGGKGTTPAAALAVRLDVLRRDVESLTCKIDTLASTQQEHSAALDTIKELRRQVEQILAILGEDDDAPPNAWFWLTMTRQQHDEKFAELFDWVETVLRRQYPDYIHDHIKPCWPNHPEAKWELTWLYQLWSHVYLSKRPTPKDAADWHDRWAPGVIHRLSGATRTCDEACHRSTAHQYDAVNS